MHLFVLLQVFLSILKAKKQDLFSKNKGIESEQSITNWSWTTNICNNLKDLGL